MQLLLIVINSVIVRQGNQKAAHELQAFHLSRNRGVEDWKSVIHLASLVK